MATRIEVKKKKKKVSFIKERQLKIRCALLHQQLLLAHELLLVDPLRSPMQRNNHKHHRSSCNHADNDDYREHPSRLHELIACCKSRAIRNFKLTELSTERRNASARRICQTNATVLAASGTSARRTIRTRPRCNTFASRRA
jgi:hypothetical protein